MMELSKKAALILHQLFLKRKFMDKMSYSS